MYSTDSIAWRFRIPSTYRSSAICDLWPNSRPTPSFPCLLCSRHTCERIVHNCYQICLQLEIVLPTLHFAKIMVTLDYNNDMQLRIIFIHNRLHNETHLHCLYKTDIPCMNGNCLKQSMNKLFKVGMNPGFWWILDGLYLNSYWSK